MTGFLSTTVSVNSVLIAISPRVFWFSFPLTGLVPRGHGHLDLRGKHDSHPGNNVEIKVKRDAVSCGASQVQGIVFVDARFRFTLFQRGECG
jgi:hypothetical protein